MIVVRVKELLGVGVLFATSFAKKSISTRIIAGDPAAYPGAQNSANKRTRLGAESERRKQILILVSAINGRNVEWIWRRSDITGAESKKEINCRRAVHDMTPAGPGARRRVRNGCVDRVKRAEPSLRRVTLYEK